MIKQAPTPDMQNTMSLDAARSILVVIPTLNEVNTIEGVLRSLGHETPPHTQVTFVVADGGSSDGTVAIVQRLAQADPRLHYLHNPRRIQSAAVNLAALQFGQGMDVLVRCDAHAQYPQHFLARLVETLDRTGADSVVVPMDSSGTTCLQKAVAWTSNTWAGTGGSAHRGGRLSGFVDHGHHAAFRMASFLRVNGYDETFSHNEDAELDCRQRRVGGKVYLDADIRLSYQPRATLKSLARQYFAYGRGRSRTVRKHPGSLRARQLAVPANLVLSTLSITLGSWLPLLLLWPMLYITALALTSVSVAWQQRSACGLLAGLAAATMHTSWALGFFAGLIFVRESAWQPAPQTLRNTNTAAGTTAP